MALPENGLDAACYLAKLSDPEWQAHIDALSAFAARVVFRFYWNTPSGLPEARTVEDFVLESVGGLCLYPHRWKHSRQRHRTLEAKLLAYLKMDLYRNMAGRAGGADNATRVPDGDPVITGTPYSRSSPEDEVTARERREFVARMRRTEKDLELFDLHYLEGLKPGEISERLGPPVSLVNSRLGEMRKRLRKRFRAEYPKYFPREDS